MGNLEHFRRMAFEDQKAYVARVNGGLCDEPEGFEIFEEIVALQEQGRGTLPGGLSPYEKAMADKRAKAGLTDRPGDEEHRRGQRLERMAQESWQRDLAGYQPAYPWQD